MHGTINKRLSTQPNTMEGQDLGLLRYYARKLNELPTPDHSPAELKSVLQWEVIPANATHIYEYALCANDFRREFGRLNFSDFDPRTRRLTFAIFRKIGLWNLKGPKYNELLGSMSGLLAVNLLYYPEQDPTSIFIARAILCLIFARVVLKKTTSERST